MRHFLILSVIALFSYGASAQGGVNIAQTTSAFHGDFVLSNLKNVKTESVLNGNPYLDVEGSAFLFDEWVLGQLMLTDGRKFDSVLLRINLFDNNVQFKDNDGNLRLLAVPLKAIHIIDSSSKFVGSWFVSDLDIDRRAMYKVVTGGKNAALLKKMKAEIRESKEHNAPPRKNFEINEDLFVQVGTKLYGEAKSCIDIAAAFSADKKVSAFVSANGIRCNKEADLIKLVNYLNKD